MSQPIIKKLKALKIAAKDLRAAGTDRKNQVLTMAARLLHERQDEILAANDKDVREFKKDKKATPAFIDRLTLNPPRLNHMIESLKQVAKLADPVGEEAEHKTLKNGLKLRRVRSPLGVILMIFESRPNVAIEAFSLAFKSGNAVILRGGRESMRTTARLYEILGEAMASAGFSKDGLWGITDADRKIPQFLLKQRRYIDVVVPRGGDGLINFVVENSEIPIIKNDRGLCHVYVHEDADLEMARRIVVNAKTQRPGVCNSLETVLVHERVAKQILPALYEDMKEFGVEWFADPNAKKILQNLGRVKNAKPVNWDTEYLDFKINAKVVSSLGEAIAHIEEHGSHHSESIITGDEGAARKFQLEVDAAAVYWNASTRFTDGFEFGLGGELGISTQKLHVRGPVGLKELTSLRWVIDGTGQTRG